MKILSLFLGLLLVTLASSLAQNRVSIAPTYWYDYNPYSYQVNANFNVLPIQSQANGYNSVSSVGLTAHYYLTPLWDLSIGVLYSRITNHIQNPQGPYGEFASFTSKGMRIPVQVGYRLTSHRLSPYFTAGAFFTKSITFNEAPIATDGVVGVGLDYRFNSALSLLLQPTGSYSFSSPTNNTFYQFTNYSSYNLGLQTQLIWHF
jgi:hypothetical protein